MNIGPRLSFEGSPATFRRADNPPAGGAFARAGRGRDHPDATQLHARATGRGAAVSLATVYRTLAALEAQGVILKLEFAGEPARFEPADGSHHDHMIDVETGEVREFVNDRIDAFRPRSPPKWAMDRPPPAGLYVRRRTLTTFDKVISDRGSRYAVSGGPAATRAEDRGAVGRPAAKKRLPRPRITPGPAILSGEAVRGDDGESGAAQIIQQMLERAPGWTDHVVIVTRWYGGKHLGGDRFAMSSMPCAIISDRTQTGH